MKHAHIVHSWSLNVAPLRLAWHCQWRFFTDSHFQGGPNLQEHAPKNEALTMPARDTVIEKLFNFEYSSNRHSGSSLEIFGSIAGCVGPLRLQAALQLNSPSRACVLELMLSEVYFTL